MERIQERFLQALGAAMKNEQAPWEAPMEAGELQGILALAELHRVLPLVYQASYTSPAVAPHRELMEAAKARTLSQVMVQTRKTAGLYPLLAAMEAAGARPLVVKGIQCRRLYPQPDHRLSTDEDILVRPEEFDLCRRVLEAQGMVCLEPEVDSYEKSFVKEKTLQLVELHRSLFAPENGACGDLNRFFTEAHSSSERVDGVRTLPPTEHLLYLLLHAFKHFLHSGVGIRQVCDMVMFANAWGSRIDWQHILDCCRQVRAEQFAAAVFRIGRKHLGFSLERSRFSLAWQAITVDEGPLLEDILAGGLYGDADMSRKHSSRITLQAASAGRANTGAGVLRSAFPPARDLTARYPYLKGRPWLLPVAWVQRIATYGSQTGRRNTPGESIRIGNQRVALLGKYGILDKK